MDAQQAIEQLEQAVQLLRSDSFEAQALRALLAPVNGWLHQQTQPPCTCGHWQGTPDNGFWYCQRHGIGAGSLSSSGAGAHRPAPSGLGLPLATLTADSHSTAGYPDTQSKEAAKKCSSQS
jgi:hypothetical protein